MTSRVCDTGTNVGPIQLLLKLGLECRNNTSTARDSQHSEGSDLTLVKDFQMIQTAFHVKCVSHNLERRLLTF